MKATHLLPAIVLAILMVIALAACTDVLGPAGTPEQPTPTDVAVSVSFGAPVGALSLPTDGSIAEVEVTVALSSSNELVESTSLSDSDNDGTWVGTIDMSDDLGATYCFRAVAKDASGDTLYYGGSGAVLVTDNSQSISIVTAAGAYGPLCLEPYLDNEGGLFLFYFSAPSNVYFQLDGTAPASAAALASSGTMLTSEADGSVALDISTLSPGTSHTLYYMGEDADAGSNQTSVLQYDFDTTNVTYVTVGGTTNLSEQWSIAAVSTDDFTPIATGGGVTSGSPNTWTVDVPEGDPSYDIIIVFYNPADTDESIMHSDTVITVGTSDVSGVELFADAVVENVDSSYGGRGAEILLYESGADPLASDPVAWRVSQVQFTEEAYAFGIVTSDGSGSDVPWTGTANTTYDVYLVIYTAAGYGKEFLATGASFSALGTLTTDPTGEPPQSTIVDATSAEYHQFLCTQVEGVDSSYDGDAIVILVYSAGADPETTDPVAIGDTILGYGDYPSGSGWTSFFVDSSGMNEWQPSASTSYDFYAQIHECDEPSDTIGAGKKFLAASTSFPSPLVGSFTIVGGAMPVTVDASSAEYLSPLAIDL